MQQERTRLILEELEKNGLVKVTDLSKMLNCSEVTIRNDIKQLEKQGLLKRNHGGATKIGVQFSRPYSRKSIYVNMDQKEKIAKHAYDLIEDHDTIIMDDSSTGFYLTKFIKENSSKHMVVVTNSLLVATELVDVNHVDLFMVGGQVTRMFVSTVGDMTINNLRNFYVDKAFIGVQGINLEVGIISIAYPQMQVKKAIMKASKELYVLADSSKFSSAYLSEICPLDNITKIITDSDILPQYQKIAKENNVPLVIVK